MKIATRGSKLALIQTEIVKKKLEALGEPCEIIVISTKGDTDRKSSFEKIGGDGLFIRELEKAVLNGEADLAVHSGKDLPFKLMDGLTIAAVPDEADCRDVIVVRHGELREILDALGLEKDEKVERNPEALEKDDSQIMKNSMPADDFQIAEASNNVGNFETVGNSKIYRNYVIGTGSPRRKAELLRIFTEGKISDKDINICIENIRGNVDTRLKKLKNGEYDAIILAKAGLDRLFGGKIIYAEKAFRAEAVDDINPDIEVSADLKAETAEVVGNEKQTELASCFDFCILSENQIMPSPCQGLLAAECRADDERTRKFLGMIEDEHARLRFDAERLLFIKLKADCSKPVGIHAEIIDNKDIASENKLIKLSAVLDKKSYMVSGEYEKLSDICDKLCSELLK